MSLGGFGYPLSPILRSLGYYHGAAAVMTKSPAMWNARSSSSSGSSDRGTLMTPTTVPIHSGFYASLLFREILSSGCHTLCFRGRHSAYHICPCKFAELKKALINFDIPVHAPGNS